MARGDKVTSFKTASGATYTDGHTGENIPIGPEIRLVGLAKIGPGKYAVVTGGPGNLTIDKTTDPLEYASEAMKRAIHHLLANMP